MPTNNNLKFALFGAGFWSRFQLAGWQEIPGNECVAIYNRSKPKAEALAKEFGIPAVYDNAAELLEKEQLDFVDIVTDPSTHLEFVTMAANHKLPVITQKPMADSFAKAVEMGEICRAAGVPLYVNENWRWQTPIRAFKEALADPALGKPFRARIDMISGFPVFENQPFLKTIDQFILFDLGTHILDVARFLFGEAETLYCHTQKVHSDIAGEDVATVLMRMEQCETVLCEVAYAENFLEKEHFPETLMFVETEKGSLELGPDFEIRKTTQQGTVVERYAPPVYPWADPQYSLIHSSIVPCQENLLSDLNGSGKAETTAEDNLRTLELVDKSYQSAKDQMAITF
jgi:D-apiose dehydrogenase